MAKDITSTARDFASLPGSTLTSLLTALTKAESEDREVAVTRPKLPALDSSVEDALLALPSLLEDAVVPVDGRELSPDERKKTVALGVAVNEIKLFVEKANKGVRTTLFNHLDRIAERTKSIGPDTPRDKDGHYLVAAEDEGFARTYTSATPKASAEGLETLVVEGIITHREYLAMTRPARVVDENALLGFIAKNPEKIGAIRRTLSFSRSPSVSLKFDK